MTITIPDYVLTIDDYEKAQEALNALIRREDSWRMQVAASTILRAFWNNPQLEQLVAYEDGTKDMTLGGFFAVPITQQDNVEDVDALSRLGLEPELTWHFYDKPFTRQRVVEQVRALFYSTDWEVTWDDFLRAHQMQLAA